MKTKIMTFAMLMAMLGISSCSKTDLYDEGKIAEKEAAEAAAEHQKVVAEYEANFVKTFGAIDSNQSWDFSTGITYFSLPNSATKAATRAAASYTRATGDDYYEFPAATISRMKEVFVEGRRENKNMGTPFYMTVPTNDFYIMPMYMGTSGGDFKLWMHVDGIEKDVCVWNKWQGMQVKGQNYWGQTVNDWTDVKTFDSSHNCTYATAIRSKYTKISGLPANAVMYFYLEITRKADGSPEDYNVKGQKLSSMNDYMREYKFTSSELPANLPGVTNPEVMIIGCEDASNLKMTDTDYNDVVFMIYGEPYVPQTFEVTELSTTYKKRYMIEDLGSSYDTDFNDIVVDVEETYKQEKTTDTHGVVTFSEPVLQGQKATIRHLGGILPFVLKVGDTTFEEMGSEATFKQDVTIEKEITGWSRVNNNISITVRQSEGSQNAWQVNFPQTGTVPMIIATDITVPWSAECVSFNWKAYMPTTPTTEP